MASPDVVVVVVDDGDDTAAPRERSAPSDAPAAPASPAIAGPSSCPPPVPRRRAPEHPILLDDDAPPTQRRRPSVARAAGTPDSVLRQPLRVDLGAAGSGIPGSAVPGSIGPGIATETSPFASSSSVQSSGVPAISSAASAHNPSGASSLISLDNGGESERGHQESAKHALKFIVAEIDTKVIESGTVGGTLLSRFAKKGLKYRVTTNPFRGSILWKMEVPQIGQDPASVSEVPYILFVLQAEEFCDLIGSGSFLDHVLTVQMSEVTIGTHPVLVVGDVHQWKRLWLAGRVQEKHFARAGEEQYRRSGELMHQYTASDSLYLLEGDKGRADEGTDGQRRSWAQATRAMARGVAKKFSLYFRSGPGRSPAQHLPPLSIDGPLHVEHPDRRTLSSQPPFEQDSRSRAKATRRPQLSDPVRLLVRRPRPASRPATPLATARPATSPGLSSSDAARNRSSGRPATSPRLQAAALSATSGLPPPSGQEDKMNKRTRTMTSFFQPQSTDSIET